MVLRTALMSLAALAVCQIGYGQSGTPQAPAANANPSEVHSESNQAATATPSPAEMNGPQMDYGLSTMPGEESTTGASCNDGSCAPGTTTYRPWWHRHLLWSYWKCHGLPSPWNPPGNLTLHVPYCNSGSTYYYFRPYNCLHISAQQAEAANDNGDPRNPYNNRVVFDGLYDGL